MTPWVLNTAWMASCFPEARAFQHATAHVQSAQARVLADMLRANRGTVFGHSHQFDAMSSVRAFQQNVPLSDYHDYMPAIDQIAAGRSHVLTRQPVELLEPTSGTTGGEKLIPFTAGLRRQFQRAVAAWMFDLLAHRPALRHGRAYWSISPALGGSRRTPAGIPIGFDDDAAYLGFAARWMLRRLVAVPADVARVAAIDEFRYQSLRYLLAAEDLTLISIWSPTFLLTLLTPLEALADRLSQDLPASSARAAAVRSILASSASLPEKLARLWPRLALISCWTDAGSARYVPALRTLFPHVALQPKGLLATEGCVSFPLLGQPAPVLAVRSHFFEFQESAAPDRIRLAHELDLGGRYRVVLTTAGGLYRYQLHDEVDIVGFARCCPLLRFVGKSDGVSDLVGEKLSEPHVRAVLDALIAKHRLAPTFVLLVPVAAPAHYRLYLQDGVATPTILAAMGDQLEAGLKENPHYAYARRLGQLDPAQIMLLDPLGPSGWTLYEQHCLSLGHRAGNIKPVSLDRRPGWPEVFTPACCPASCPAS